MSDFFEALEIDVDETDFINVKELSGMDLLDLYYTQDRILIELGQVLHPVTQEARDAHSLRGACKIELVHRGIL